MDSLRGEEENGGGGGGRGGGWRRRCFSALALLFVVELSFANDDDCTISFEVFCACGFNFIADVSSMYHK